MLIGIGALAALIALFAGMAMRTTARNKASLNWPSVEGDILVSEVRSKWSTNGQGQAEMRHTPDIQFSYVVDGQTYAGKRVSFYGGLIDTAAKAQALCDRYPAGAKTPVYYNPKKPGDSVLERRADKA